MERNMMYYTNSARVSSTIYDLQIRFFYKSIVEYLSADPQEDDAHGDLLCEVSMSLPHAKALVELLQNNITAYEKNIGPITVKQQNNPENNNPINEE